MCTSVVSCCDASPIFEFSEQVLDDVSFFVEFCIVGDLDLAVFTAGNDGIDAFLDEGFA